MESLPWQTSKFRRKNEKWGNMQNILAIGFDTRNIVCSASRAGYKICSIDAFQDLDLQKCAYASALLECRTSSELRQLDPRWIIAKMNTFGLEFDAIVPGSGMEMLDPGGFPCPVLASCPDAVKEASNKKHLAKKLEALEMPHPQCYSPEELDAIEYPVILKPSSGGGGIFNRVARDRQELLAAFEELARLDPGLVAEELIIQDFLEGIPSSVSLLSTKSQALAVAVNEQLIGIPWLSRLPFAYCGNVTPFRTKHAEEMEALAEELVLELGLLGSNGVDFLVTEKGPVVLEVNPRFQGSLDTIEMATGINLFEAHIGCFRGELPEKPEAKRFVARGVIYSDRELFIDRKLMDVILREKSADIPSMGTVTEPDWPLTSLFACASTKDEAVRSLERGAERIKSFIVNRTKEEREPLNPAREA